MKIYETRNDERTLKHYDTCGLTSWTENDKKPLRKKVQKVTEPTKTKHCMIFNQINAQLSE